MSTSDPLAPAAIPWYRSAVLRGILTIIVTQLISRITAQYHIDASLFGLNIADVVNWLMDAISAGAAAYAVHGRVAKPVPPVTLTKTDADKANLTPELPK